MGYMLDERFCNLCYEPLHGETQRCPVCGQKTTPITLSERLRADETFAKQRNKPFICALVITAACLFHLAWCCIGGLTLYRKITAPPAPVQQAESVSVPSFHLTEEEQKRNDRIALLMERALDYEDRGEFLRAFCSSRSQEDIEFYCGVWTNAWLAKSLRENADSMPATVQPIARDPDEITVLGFVGYSGVLAAALDALMTLWHIYYCARYWLGAKNGFARLVGFSMEHSKVIPLTLDIPAFAAIIAAVASLEALNRRLGGEKLRRTRSLRVFKAKQAGGLADRDIWLCECGKVNNKRDSECVSCGRYKPLPKRATVQRERG